MAHNSNSFNNLYIYIMKTWLYNLLIILITVAIFAWATKRGCNMYKTLDLMKSNQEQLLKDLPDQNLFMTKKEFKDYQKQMNDSLFKKLKDSLNIGFRNITKTINHRYRYTYDTTKTILIRYENTPDFYFKKDLDSCLSIKGHIDLADSTIYFDEVAIDYNSNTIYYFKRKKLLGFIPLGRKQFYTVTENNCSGQAETRSIEIIKSK